MPEKISIISEHPVANELLQPTVEADNISAIFEADFHDMLANDAVVSRKHEDGKIYSGSISQLGKIAECMKGKTPEQIARDVAFANLADAIRAGKPVDEVVKNSSLSKDKSVTVETNESKKTHHIKNNEQGVEPSETVTVDSIMLRPEIIQSVATLPVERMQQEVMRQSVTKPELVKTEEAQLQVEIEPVKTPKTLVEASSPEPTKTELEQFVRPQIILEQPPAGPSPIVNEKREFTAIEQPDSTVETDEAEVSTYSSLEVEIDDSPVLQKTTDTEMPTPLVAEIIDAPVLETRATDRSNEIDQQLVSESEVIVEFLNIMLPSTIIEGLQESVQLTIETLSPEAASEVYAQVEQLVIVSDRLHELMVTGKEASEEAQQIIAFVSREYEQLLLAVGIEPTEELIKAFIMYIKSEAYESITIATNSVDAYVDEGTHEKKLFDEQSVFAKARQASATLGNKLNLAIGRLALTDR